MAPRTSLHATGAAPASIRWDRRQARHLLSRAGFGGTPEEVDHLVSLGRKAAVEHLLTAAVTAPAPEPPAWVRLPWVDTEARLPGLAREELTRRHVATRLRYRQEMEQLKLWWLERMVRSTAPLREKMTLFWHWHLPTAHAKVFASQAHWTQNELYRRFAVGNFRELMREVTLDPAMMLYLDSHTNHREQPNENYARELMELFTLGIGNYSEADIKEAARALSGWSLEGLTPKLTFDAQDRGGKSVFGKAGAYDAMEVVDLCVEHPASAPFLMGKLLRFFGVADPTGSAARRLAATFRTSNHELKPVLRELFLSPEFAAEESMGSQIKCPVQLVVGMLRLLPVEWKPTPPLAQALARMGQDLFNPPNVKGWLVDRDMVTTSTLMARYHTAELVLESRVPAGFAPGAPERQRVMQPDEARTRPAAVSMLLEQSDHEGARAQQVEIRLDAARLFPQGCPEPAEASRQLCSRLLAAEPSRELVRAVADAMGAAPQERRVSVGLRLILNSPEFQVA